MLRMWSRSWPRTRPDGSRVPVSRSTEGRSFSAGGYDSKPTSRPSTERKFMSAIIQANPLEKLPQEPLPTGDSCVLVIFGASGDLTKRKLIPGLYNLSCEGCMNPEFPNSSFWHRESPRWQDRLRSRDCDQ